MLEAAEGDTFRGRISHREILAPLKALKLGADISCYPILTLRNQTVPGMCQGERRNGQRDLAGAIVESQRAAL